MAEVYITVDAANALLRSMVDAQINAFGAQQRSIESLNAETQALINQTREDVHQSLLTNKAAAEAYVVEQVGALRTQTQSSVNHVDSKLEEMRDLLLQHDKTQTESGTKSKELVEQLESRSQGLDPEDARGSEPHAAGDHSTD